MTRYALLLLCALSLALLGWIPADDAGIRAGMFTIAGVVKDTTTGGLVEGAYVRLWKATSPDDEPIIKITDSKGRFNYSVNATAGWLELLVSKEGLLWHEGSCPAGVTCQKEGPRGGLYFRLLTAGVYEEFVLGLTDGTIPPTVTPSQTAVPLPTMTYTPIASKTPTPEPTVDPGIYPPHRFTLVTIDQGGAPVTHVWVRVEYMNGAVTLGAFTDNDGIARLDVPAYQGPYNPYVDAPTGWRCLTIHVDGQDFYEPVPTPIGGNRQCEQCFWLPLVAEVTTVTWVLAPETVITQTPSPAPTMTYTPRPPTMTPTPTKTPTPSPVPTPRGEALAVAVGDVTDGPAHALPNVPITLYSGALVWTVNTSDITDYGRMGYSDFSYSGLIWPLEIHVRLDGYTQVGVVAYGVSSLTLEPFRIQLDWTGEEPEAVVVVLVERIPPTATPTPTVTPTFTPTPITSPEPVERVHVCGDLVRWSDGHWSFEDGQALPMVEEGR